MRDPLRIPKILANIQYEWQKHPDMRFGQFLTFIGYLRSAEQFDGHDQPPLNKGLVRDPFHVEDEWLMTLLRDPEAR